MSLIGDLFGQIRLFVIPNDLTINGDLQVNGNINNTGDVFTADRIVVLNDGESGAGVTGGLAGFEIDRGTETNYQLVFDESEDVFKLGEVGSLQYIVTRSGPITEGRIPFGTSTNSYTEDAGLFWDNTNKRLGLGGVTPQEAAHVHSSNSATWMQITNASSGVASEDGLRVGLDSSVAYLVTDTGIDIATSAGGGLGMVNWANGNVSFRRVSANTGGFEIQMAGDVGLDNTLTVAGKSTLDELEAASSNGHLIRRTGAADSSPILTLQTGVINTFEFTKDGRLGIGPISTPNYTIQSHKDTAADNYFQFTNDTTGSGTGDGFLIGIGSTGTANLIQRENINMQFFTNNTLYMTLRNDGNLGVGLSNPEAKADVVGMIRSTGQNLPVSGSGIEMDFSAGIGRIRSYNRTGASFLRTEVTGSSVALAINGTTTLELDTDLTLSVSDINRNNSTGILSLSGSTSNSGVARIDIYGSSEGTNPNDINIYALEQIWRSEGGAQRMRLTGTGLKIGTGAPSYPLDVTGIINCTGGYYENGSPLVTSTLWDSNTASDAVTPAATWDDFVGIGITSPNYRLHVHEPSTGLSTFQMTNTQSGNGTTDGFRLRFDSSRVGGSMSFFMDSEEHIRMEQQGIRVGNNLQNSANFVSDQLEIVSSSNTSALRFFTDDMSGAGEFRIALFDEEIRFQNFVNNAYVTWLTSASTVGKFDFRDAYFLEFDAAKSTPAVSDAGDCRLYWDGTDFLISKDGGAYEAIGAGSGSGSAIAEQPERIGKIENALRYYDEIELSASLDKVTGIAYAGAGRLLVGTGTGTGDGDVWESTDYGATWANKSSPGAQYEGVLAMKHLGGKVFMCGTQNDSGDGDIYRSTDDGVTWVQSTDVRSTFQLLSIEQCGNNVVLVGCSGASGHEDIFKSTDGGVVFSTSAVFNGGFSSIAKILYLGNDIVLAGTTGSNGQGRLIRSTDNGDNWSTIIAAQSGRNGYTDFAHAGGGVVYATVRGTNNGDAKVIKSTDYGASWDSGVVLTGCRNNFNITALPNGVVVATASPSGADVEIFISTDEGATFTSIATLTGRNGTQDMVYADGWQRAEMRVQRRLLGLALETVES